MSNVIELGKVPSFSHLDERAVDNFLWFARFCKGMEELEGNRETVSMRVWRTKLEQEKAKRERSRATIGPAYL